ncbi:Uncharacterized conserved protein YafD, endonuclease/exonuclease/phosphatase (EEP) superfamily [Pasteurella testudinis DSM 23072]|uniref:Uncharacterized conserved protein YafD, endonuclease/exonuclease/phosphatase (EEP) superfamily n=1 Tax=Pasteurella testudinis DSM 23072 TaxID=1122938 RepID=A0A1W1UQ30_9PAST|nr:endonuclease/exonuclease/phosphatase family protein [Pasteurella testudinis]SMB82911.1 Uncharacterized conserved protein YafD, endonuclease/exonuclease/phosphatase (EEP) superfamily [Pasteurella testudinis DSM 23072]SUB51527.1 Uncharacterized protein conserved in bacteria [Pasteurella testudinis]
MKKLSRFCLYGSVFLALLLSVALYRLSFLEIFAQAKIETFNLPPSAYQQTALSANTVCFNHQAPLRAEVALKARFQLVVWNLHKGQDAGWQQKIEQYSQQADFLLLQEATVQNQIPHFLADDKTWYGIQAGTFAYHGDMSGVMLLANYLPQRYCVGSENEPWIRIPKIAQAAVYPLAADRTLLIINLHLVNFEWNPQNYRNQLREMFRLVSQHQGPIILAGDFNSWNSKRLSLIQELAQQYALSEVRFTPDVRMNFMGNPLDHIFVRDIQVLSAYSEQTTASDHNPLVVEFELNVQN